MTVMQLNDAWMIGNCSDLGTKDKVIFPPGRGIQKLQAKVQFSTYKRTPWKHEVPWGQCTHHSAEFWLLKSFCKIFLWKCMSPMKNTNNTETILYFKVNKAAFSETETRDNKCFLFILFFWKIPSYQGKWEKTVGIKIFLKNQTCLE